MPAAPKKTDESKVVEEDTTVDVVEADAAPEVPDVEYQEHQNAEAQASPLDVSVVEVDEDDYVPYVHEPDMVFAQTEAPQTEEV